MLKLNPDKTEFLLLGNSSNESKLSNCFPIEFLRSLVSPTDKVRNLGVLFDAEFSLSNQVSSICLVSSCYYHLRDLSCIRKHLSKSVAVTMANALISSRLDGVNSILLGLPDKELNRLQTIQNILCRIVCRLLRRSHVTSSLKKLHWLPVKSRILNTITYKALNTSHPSYLKRFITPYTCTVNTRQSDPSKKVLTGFSFKARIYL
jgi:hypothetical protein